MNVIKTDWQHIPVGDNAIVKVDLFSDGDCELTLSKDSGSDRMVLRRSGALMYDTLRRLTDKLSEHVR